MNLFVVIEPSRPCSLSMLVMHLNLLASLLSPSLAGA